MNILTSADRVFLEKALTDNTDNYHKSMEVLASGYKITESRDDVVMYTKIQTYDKNISQYNVILDNISIANQALNLVSEAQGRILNGIERVRDLCLQMSNGTYSDLDKSSIFKEIHAQLEYIDYVASSTTYNDKNLLDGSITSYLIQLDTNEAMDISNVMVDLHAAALNIDIAPTITSDTWTYDDIQAYIKKLEAASSSVIFLQTKTGALSTNLDNESELADEAIVNCTESKSALADVDYAYAASDLVRRQILQQLSINVMVNANQLAQQTFSTLFSGMR